MTYFSFNDAPYIWSSSPNSLEPLSEGMEDALYLPSFVLGINRGQSSHIEHGAATEYIMSKGIDPLTQDYSRSQGFMLFEILSMAGDDCCFEIVEDDMTGRHPD